MAAYDFFSRQFHLPAIKEDPEIGAEVKSYDELKVGLPDDNLTIVGLARELADSVQRDSAAGGLDAERARLRTLLRYHPAKIDRLWTTGISKHGGVETSPTCSPWPEGCLPLPSGSSPSESPRRPQPPSSSTTKAVALPPFPSPIA